MTNNENIFTKLAHILKNPDDFGELYIEVVIATLNILNNRLNTSGFNYILDEEITKAEFEEYYQQFSSIEELVDVLTVMKQDIEIN